MPSVCCKSIHFEASPVKAIVLWKGQKEKKKTLPNQANSFISALSQQQLLQGLGTWYSTVTLQRL